MRRLVKITALCLCLVILSSFCLVGCHGQQSLEPFSMPAVPDLTKEYNITFWAKNENYPTQIEAYNNAVESFEALYPNINVTLRSYTNYNDIYNDVLTNIRTKTTPNVCITYPDHIATYLTGLNTVVPLDGLMRDESYGLGGSALKFDSPTVDEIEPKFLEECKIGDSYYALPFMRSTEACYVNKTYVEKLGFEMPEILTWDFIWQVSLAATEKDGEGNYLVNGQKVMIPFIYKSTDNMMITYLKQMGAEYSNDNGDILVFNDTAKDFLLCLADAKKDGAFDTFDNVGYPANYLNRGQCIFAIDSTAGSMWMGSEAPELDVPEEECVDFECSVMAIPQVNPEQPVMISQGPSICIFNKEDSEEVFASWLFAQFLLTNEVQIAYSQTEGYCPVTIKAKQTAEYAEYLASPGKDSTTHYKVKIAATRLLIDNVDNTFVTPVFNGSTSLRNASGEMVDNVVKAIERRKTVDEKYVDNLYEDMKKLYKLNYNRVKNEVDFGPMPISSTVLIVSVSVIWVGIIAYVVWDKVQKQKKIKNINKP